MKINYIIATYSGIYERRYDKKNLASMKRENYLHIHLEVLNLLSNSINQISIIKPKVNKEHTEIKDYYKFENLKIDKIKDKIKIIDCENLGASYHQLLLNLYINKDEFEYHIFTEDDYIPSQYNFDEVLIKKYKTNNSCHFLCAGIILNEKFNWSKKIYNSNFEVADFSLGIFDKKTILNLFEKKTYDEIKKYFLEFKDRELHISQVVFSKILSDCDIQITDWCGDFLSIFYENSTNEYFLLNYVRENWKLLKRTPEKKDKRYISPIFLPIEALEHLRSSIEFITDNYLIDYILSNIYYKLSNLVK
jgi:hypothetical protein